MKILTLEEACEYLYISETSISDLISSGELPAAKIGKCWIFRDVDLEDYVTEQIRTQTKVRREAYLSGQLVNVKTAVGVVRNKKRRLADLPKLPDAVAQS